MAGLGVLFAGLSGAGRALASSAQEEQRVNDESRLMAERARLEEEKALRIDEARRKSERQAGVQMGADISTATADLQNQRDAEAINAANGSQMTAADAAVLRNNPEARKAYGLLGSSRQTDLEDRATAAERLGYLDAAKETRGQLQTEFVNQRTIKQDENADARLKAEQAWREKQADLAAKREDRMMRVQEAQLAFTRSRAAKSDSDESKMAEREARMATTAALKGYETEIRQLAKDAADPLLAPEQKAVVQQQIDEARAEAARLRKALSGAGLEGAKPAAKDGLPDLSQYAIGGASSGTSAGSNGNPVGGGPVPARLTADAQRRLAEAEKAKTPADERRELAERAREQAASFGAGKGGGNRAQQLKAEEARASIASLERKYQDAMARMERGKGQSGPPGLALRAEAEVRAAKAALDEAKAAAR